ncbi:STAS domain-containing protein [Acidobacteria bacterium AH-259-L09]|nr:STAS domain-containing protein [Acidobacteria bacterium AH-259-L09]
MEVKVEDQEGVFFIIPSGELSTGEGDKRLRQELDRLQRAGNTKVVIDLSDVPYIDSSVLGQLVYGHSVLKKEGGGLKLLNPSKRIMDLLSLTRLISVFEISQSREEALAGWKH